MKRKADFMMQDVGGQKLLVPLGAQVRDQNAVITVNETGACLWDLLRQECTAAELAAALEERFDVPPEGARTDVRIFLDEIAKMGLLE